MNSNISKTFVMLSVLVAASSLCGSNILQDISGVYKLVQVNGETLPATSWIGPSAGCKQENLSGTLLVDSGNNWAVLIQEREICTRPSEGTTTGTVNSAILIGNYKVSGDGYQFHDETLGITDYVSIDEEFLRYTTIGIGDFEGQTAEYIFVREL